MWSRGRLSSDVLPTGFELQLSAEGPFQSSVDMALSSEIAQQLLGSGKVCFCYFVFAVVVVRCCLTVGGWAWVSRGRRGSGVGGVGWADGRVLGARRWNVSGCVNIHEGGVFFF